MHLVGTSILQHFYDTSFLVLPALNAKMTPHFLLNDYQNFGQNCCFPSGDMTTYIAISFWTSGSFLYKHKCSFFVYVYVSGARIVLGQKQATRLTVKSVDGTRIWPQSSLTALFSGTSQPLCYRPRYEWYAISRYLSLSMLLNVCLFRVAAHFTYCSGCCSNNESAA
jgi:hypothetical protein